MTDQVITVHPLKTGIGTSSAIQQALEIHFQNIADTLPDSFTAQNQLAITKNLGSFLGHAGVALEVFSANDGQQIEAGIVAYTNFRITSALTAAAPGIQAKIGAAIGGMVWSTFSQQPLTDALDGFTTDLVDNLILSQTVLPDGRYQSNLGNNQEFISNPDTGEFIFKNNNTGTEFITRLDSSGNIMAQGLFEGSKGFTINRDGIVAATDGINPIFTEDLSNGSEPSQALQNILDSMNLDGDAIQQQIMDAAKTDLNLSDVADEDWDSWGFNTPEAFLETDINAPIPSRKPVLVTNPEGSIDLYEPHEGDVGSAVQNYGGSVSADSVIAIEQPDGSFISFIAEGAETIIDGITYGIEKIADAIEYSAQQLSEFISHQVNDAVSWFTDDTNGAQLAFANWLATNVEDLTNGTLDPAAAFIDLAEYLAAQYIGHQISGTLNFTEAEILMNQVFIDIGLAPAEAQVFTQGFSSALERMAVEFALSGGNWDGSEMTQVATAAFTAVVANKYASDIILPKYGPASQSQLANVSGTVAAVTTLATGLLNSGGYSQTEWVLLGVNSGVAYASAYTGSYVATQLASIGSVAGPVGIVAGAITGIFLGNVIGGIYSGKSFKPGEFPSMQAAISSQYVVQQIDDGTGNVVDALVAVSPEGSVIIAQDITHIIGNSGHDTLVGNELDNVIDGQDGDDYIEGRDGVDGLFGGAGGDHIVGNAGDDIIDGGDGDDELFGGSGDDTILGGDGYDFIMGADGNDTIIAGDDRDIVLAGLGDDIVDAGAGNDFVDGGSGDDVLVGGDGDDVLLGNVGNDTLAGDAGNDKLFGEDGNDTLNGGQGNDFIDGGSGTNILTGESGNDLIIGGLDNDFLDGGIGADRLNGGAGDDQLFGGLDNDLLVGDIGDDILDGGDGDDIFIAGQGNDILEGGDGNDRYLFSIGDGINRVTDSSGVERIAFSLVSSLDVVFSEDGNDLIVSYGADGDSIRIVDQLTAPVIEMLELSDGQIDLTALSFVGGVASYTLDSLTDSIVTDIETSLLAQIQDTAAEISAVTKNQVLQNLGQTAFIETIRENADSQTYNGSEIISYSKYRGSFLGKKFGKYTAYKIVKDTEIDGQTDVIELTVLDQGESTAGYDNVFTNAEISTSKYYYGNYSGGLRYRTTVTDIFVDGEAIATYVEYGVRPHTGATVQVYKTETIDPNDKIRLVDDNVLSINALLDAYDRRSYADIDNVTIGEKQLQVSMDVIIGTAVNETINGGYGNDLLYGGGGEDIIDGGSGDDWVFGNSASDTLDGGMDNDFIHGGAVDDIIYGGAGNDGIIGAGGNDTIDGGSGDDWIDGGDGDDTIIGSEGDDVVDGGDGYDMINYSNITTSLDIDLTNNTVINAAFVHYINSIESIIASSANDYIIGNNEDNILKGSLGDDTIYGNGGNDQLTGDEGADTLYGGDGNDILKGRHDDDILYGGAGDDILYGQNDDDEIYGEDGDDILNGGNGHDYIDGGAGNDTLSFNGFTSAIVANLSTNYYYSAGFGVHNYSVLSIENLEGSSYNDTLTGDAQDNKIVATIGNDTINGGAGIDTIDYSNITTAINIDLISSKYDIDYNGVNDHSLSNIENFIGSQYSDRIRGDALANIIHGQNGDDILIGNLGDDILYGEGGNDQLTGDEGADTLYGGDGDDILKGRHDNDILYGGDGDDTLYGQNDDDQLYGEDGDDILNGGNGHDYIDGGAGNDILSFNGFASAVQANLETNYYYSAGFGVHNYTVLNVEGLEGSNSADILTGDSNDNLFIASSGNDTIDGGDGVDTIDYSNRISRVHIDFVRNIYDIDFNGSNDHSIINIENITGSQYADDLRGSSIDNVIDGQGGDDKLVGFEGNDKLYGGAGHDRLFGSEGNDELYGQSGHDHLDGGDGDDFLSGVSGNDSLYGGVGNDTLYGGDGDDILDGGDGDDLILASDGNDTVDGGIGIDTIDYSNSEAITTAIHIDLTSGVYDIDFNGSNDHSVINVENIIGSQYADTIRGDALANIIHGQNGDDILIGSLGDDTLYGEDGNDQLTGDEGADILYGGDGNDILKGRHDNDVLYGGDGDDILYGQNEDDEIYGGAGNDILDGGNGHDYIDGGDGQDTLSFASFFYAVEADLSTHYYYSTNFGVHNYTVINIEGLEGSDYSDILTGDDQDNVIRGRLGNDTIHAGIGADTIYGGLGVDTIYGGDGDDIIDGEDHDDVLRGGDGDDTIYGGVGHDDLYGDNGNDELYGQSGNDTLYGGDGDDFLSGVSGNDELHGGAGNDVLYGGADNDIINGDDGDDLILASAGNDTVDGGAGIDTIDYSNSESITTAIHIDLTNGVYDIDFNGSNDHSVINVENIVGSQYADTITGDSLDNIFFGQNGDDIIDGGGGDDMIDGGDGDDKIIASDGDDIIDGGDGKDSINYLNINASLDIDLELKTVVSASFVHQVNSIELIKAGSANDVFKGSSGDDIFFGQGGNDVMDGYAGNDKLFGGDGDDVLYSGQGDNQLSGGDGYDIISYANHTSHITIDMRAGFADVDGNGISDDTILDTEEVIGTDYDDEIRGTDGEDVLDGGAGNDLLIGYLGDDILYGRAGDDVLNGSNGDDVLYGGDGNDRLIGYKHNDVLDGGAGDDELFGGRDSDTLTGGYGADTFFFDADAFIGVDLVTDFNLLEGDMIDLSSILDSLYDPISDAISDFIRFTDSGSDSLLQVDQNGGADSFVTIAQLTGHNGLDADVLETNGHLITEYV